MTFLRVSCSSDFERVLSDLKQFSIPTLYALGAESLLVWPTSFFLAFFGFSSFLLGDTPARNGEMATAACSAERSLATKASTDSSSYDLNSSTKGYLMESSPAPIGVHLPNLDPVPPLLPLVEHDINLFSPKCVRLRYAAHAPRNVSVRCASGCPFLSDNVLPSRLLGNIGLRKTSLL